jgi:hypothetical protein
MATQYSSYTDLLPTHNFLAHKILGVYIVCARVSKTLTTIMRRSLFETQYKYVLSDYINVHPLRNRSETRPPTEPNRKRSIPPPPKSQEGHPPAPPRHPNSPRPNSHRRIDPDAAAAVSGGIAPGEAVGYTPPHGLHRPRPPPGHRVLPPDRLERP